MQNISKTVLIFGMKNNISPEFTEFLLCNMMLFLARLLVRILFSQARNCFRSFCKIKAK